MLDTILAYFHENAGLLAARAASALVSFVIVAVIGSIAAGLVERTLERRGPRGTTLAPIARTVVKLTTLVAAAVMAMSQMGINIATVLAGAGVLGLAVGFGAQTLVKDCISGFFLILDDVLQVGDLAMVDDKQGVVEKVGLRVTQIRAFSGQLWYIPNGSIEKVGNFNREWNRADVGVGIAYEADVTRALEVLGEVGAAWAKDNPKVSLEPPVAQGLIELGDSSVTVRIIGKIAPLMLAEVERDLRRRAKAALEAAGVEISYPKTVVYLQNAGSAPSGEVQADGEKS